MALNIPNVDSPGNSFIKGIDTGSNMFAKIMNARYNNSLHPSGDVANALYVEQLRKQYGDKDPRYLEAKRAHEMVLQARQSLIGYRDVLNQTAGIRATSPLGRLIAEGKGQGAIDILKGQGQGGAQTSQGQQGAHATPQVQGGQQGSQAVAPNAPGVPKDARYKEGEQYYNSEGDPVYADDETETKNKTDTNPRTSEERRAYEKAIAKQTTDAAVRNKIPYAENVKITMDSIDPKILTQFSGLKGHFKLAKELWNMSKGNPSPEYLEYQKNVTSADTLKKQLRQFWGESIQPSATEQIGKLTNPSTWLKDPAVAEQQFNQLKKITEQELKSFTAHGTSPIKLDYDEKKGFYTDEEEEPKKSALQQKVEGSGKKSSAPKITKEDREYANVVSGQISDVMPKATGEAIVQTAIAENKSVDEVIEKLVAQAAKMRGGQ
jgi:hypothetical protein